MPTFAYQGGAEIPAPAHLRTRNSTVLTQYVISDAYACSDIAPKPWRKPRTPESPSLDDW